MDSLDHAGAEIALHLEHIILFYQEVASEAIFKLEKKRSSTHMQAFDPFSSSLLGSSRCCGGSSSG
jgi:hypothetical protein